MRARCIGKSPRSTIDTFLRKPRSPHQSAERIEEGSTLYRIRSESRDTTVGVFPRSIDAREFADFKEVAPGGEGSGLPERMLARYRLDGSRSPLMMLGVDRLDYTKGLIHKLKAFQLLLRHHPELRRKVVLVQLVVPSREDIPAYDSLKDQVNSMVGEILGEFGETGWSPIQYTYGRWTRRTLVAHYRAAQVVLVTPLKDGMNLVAKEYCSANVQSDGVLVLSVHAGAAAQLHRDALMVNPYDVQELAEVMYRACTMEPAEQQDTHGGDHCQGHRQAGCARTSQADSEGPFAHSEVR